MQVLRNAVLPVSRWANGAGRKADLAAGDGWTTGFAWLDADAPFSDFRGMDRTITLVEGPGFTLDVDGRPVVVDARFAPTAFDGGAATTCRVIGPSRVLNAMTDRARWRHEVTILDRGTRIAPGICVTVVLDGEARIGGTVLGRLDAVRLEQGGDLAIAPGSRAAVITVRGV